MKNKIFCGLVCVFAAGRVMASDMLPAGGYYETQSHNCDMAAMEAELDRATSDRRAVITVVKCTPRAEVQSVYGNEANSLVAIDDCTECMPTIERIVDRRVYVEETVQQYRPVVRYEPAGRYTRMHRVCSECDT